MIRDLWNAIIRVLRAHGLVQDRAIDAMGRFCDCKRLFLEPDGQYLFRMMSECWRGKLRAPERPS